MSDAFSGILGQPKVRDFLRQSVMSDRVTHAYLFVGPSGSNKTQAAYSLAQALLCPKVGDNLRATLCGQCENCKRAKKKVHPDIHYYYPEGANGYLIDQIKEIVSDISLAPVQATRKVYIIDRADLLGRGVASAANALLKTLEEPPDNVILILLGRTRESMLETIASRCQVVPFRHIPPSEAQGIISQNTGAEISLAKYALEAADGSLTGAIKFLNSGNNRLEMRKKLISNICSIPVISSWQALQISKQIVIDCNAQLDAFKAELEEKLSANKDFLEKSAIRKLEEKNKRMESRTAQEYLNTSLSIISSVLRDAIMIQNGCEVLVINNDFFDEIRTLSKLTNTASISRMIKDVDSAKSSLVYNVSPELCIDKVLITLRRTFNDTSCTS